MESFDTWWKKKESVLAHGSADDVYGSNDTSSSSSKTSSNAPQEVTTFEVFKELRNRLQATQGQYTPQHVEIDAIKTCMTGAFTRYVGVSAVVGAGVAVLWRTRFRSVSPWIGVPACFFVGTSFGESFAKSAVQETCLKRVLSLNTPIGREVESIIRERNPNSPYLRMVPDVAPEDRAPRLMEVAGARTRHNTTSAVPSASDDSFRQPTMASRIPRTEEVASADSGAIVTDDPFSFMGAASHDAKPSATSHDNGWGWDGEVQSSDTATPSPQLATALQQRRSRQRAEARSSVFSSEAPSRTDELLIDDSIETHEHQPGFSGKSF